MNDEEIQARAVIAADLIQARVYDMSMAHQHEEKPSGHLQLSNLRTAVDVIYRALMNPK